MSHLAFIFGDKVQRSNLASKRVFSFGRSRVCGFTFVEVMLVILVIGLLATGVVGNLYSSSANDKAIKEAKRFVAVYNLASEFALLNNIEIGVYVEDNSYSFLGFDGQKWAELPRNDTLLNYQLPDDVEMTLVLDDLPVDETELISQVDFEALMEDDEDSLLDSEQSVEEKRKNPVPQLLIFSSGEITPFIAEFRLAELDYDEDFVEAIEVEGKYATPVKIVEAEEDDS